MPYRFNPFTGNLDQIGASVWERITDTVTALQTDVVDSIDNNLFKGVKYIVNVFNSAQNVYNSFELSVLNANGNYKDVVDTKIKSGNINFEVNTFNNAGTFELKIVNNESYDLTIEATKMSILV